MPRQVVPSPGIAGAKKAWGDDCDVVERQQK